MDATHAQGGTGPIGLGAASRSAVASVTAFARLVDAEIDLAAAALPRALLLGVLTAAFAAGTVALAAALVMSIAVAMGASWPAALAVACGLTLLATAGLALYASRLLRECTLPVTRRRLHALWPDDGDDAEAAPRPASSPAAEPSR